MDDGVWAGFVSARLDEVEAAALEAAGADGRFGGRPHWSALGHGMVADTADPDWGVVDLGPCIDDDALAGHIALHDPARELRRVTVDRAIVGWHVPVEDCEPPQCVVCLEHVPCRTLRALASVWSDRPDYPGRQDGKRLP